MLNKNFPSCGLTYFWFINDYCDDIAVDKQIDEFVKKGFKTVCIHPRDGLMLPYGGTDWFDFLTKTAKKLKKNGIEIWLYDDSPYPSGNAGGKIVLEHPEFRAKKIVMHKIDKTNIKDEKVWFFPANGKLLLCATFSEDGEFISDYTENVGLIAHTWSHLKNWDSRWYYPATPLYICDRAMCNKQEYALNIENISNSNSLFAFTIEEVESARWGTFVDTLNIDATKEFIRITHDKYFENLSEMFGKEITAIFSDEVSYKGHTPYCDNLFKEFQKIYGYDLKLRLYDIFSEQNSLKAQQTRIDYRQYLGDRLKKCWFEPISKWCKKHNLALVGHVSPEDDIVSQTQNVSNLFPIQKEFALGGLDLIIPAVGDANHPMINIGVLGAVSVAQQTKKVGVMCEMLACSSHDFPPEMAQKIILWQTVMGVTTPVIHGAFLSVRDERLSECPPDFGPWTKFGECLSKLNKSIQEVQSIMIGAKQIAPIAILWPIKSFLVKNAWWQAEDNGLRQEFNMFILKCLQNQLGIQLLDEEDFHKTKIRNGKVCIGNAKYSQIIIPPSLIWSEKTWSLLEEYQNNNIDIFQYGTQPKYLKGVDKIKELDNQPFAKLSENKLIKNINITSLDKDNIRVTKWEKDKKIFYTLFYLGKGECEARCLGEKLLLSSEKITVLCEKKG